MQGLRKASIAGAMTLAGGGVAAEPVALYAAGSLKAALSDVAEGFSATYGTMSRPRSVPRA